MTPGARVQAAIEILDRVQDGQPAEQALTRWARSSRFAGSKDRAAVRDHVFDALRKRASAAARGGSPDGRGLMIGTLTEAGADVAALFTGEGHAPARLSAAEAAHLETPPEVSRSERLDVPDWLMAEMDRSLGDRCDALLARLRDRAPVFLRVNTGKATGPQVQRALEAEGITTEPHLLAATALEVTGNARRVSQSACYRDGLVELQDVASQAVVAALPLPETGQILDYCAGGGGKALAMAAACGAGIVAHDAAPARMRDLPARARRAGVRIETCDGDGVRSHAPFDLVLCDVPCSGSGAWRRSPDAKWRFTRQDLDRLLSLQRSILDEAVSLVAPGGVLAYATCSLLRAENLDQVTRWDADHPEFRLTDTRSFTPLEGGDGLFVAVLRKQSD